MIKNKESYLIRFLCLIVIIFLGFSIYNKIIFKSNIYDFSGKNYYQPFDEDNIILKSDISLKINENMPSIYAASAFYPLAATIVENSYNKENFDDSLLSLVSTNEAIEGIINEEADFAIVTAPSEKQNEEIVSSGKDIVLKKITNEKLVFYVSKSNNISNLTIGNLKNIYENDLYWNEFIEGFDDKIFTYKLEDGNGSQTAFQNLITKNDIINENHIELKYMNDIIDKVSNINNGIGYAFYSYYSKLHINNNLKTIKINNFDVDDNNYPLQVDLYMMYEEDNASKEDIDKIYNFLVSEEGQNFIKEFNDYKIEF